MKPLDGNVALVTGASRGVGELFGRIAVEGDGGLGVLLPWQQHLLSIGR